MTAPTSAPADTTTPRWELLPKGTPEMRIPLDDPGDGAERTRGHVRAVGVMVAAAAIVAGIAWIDELLAVLAVIVAVVAFLVQYRRNGGGARYRGMLTEWAQERGLEDVGGPIWSWDGSTPVPKDVVERASIGARDADLAVRLDHAAQLRGRIWDAAGPAATITAVHVRSPNETQLYAPIITVPLGAPQVGPMPTRIHGIDGYALADGQLEVWCEGNLLLDLAMERWGRTTNTPYGLYAGGSDRMLALLGHARDVHRALVGG